MHFSKFEKERTDIRGMCMWESGCSRDKRRSKVGKSVFAAGSLKVRGEKVGKEGVGRGFINSFAFHYRRAVHQSVLCLSLSSSFSPYFPMRD